MDMPHPDSRVCYEWLYYEILIPQPHSKYADLNSSDRVPGIDIMSPACPGPHHGACRSGTANLWHVATHHALPDLHNSDIQTLHFLIVEPALRSTIAIAWMRTVGIERLELLTCSCCCSDITPHSEEVEPEDA